MRRIHRTPGRGESRLGTTVTLTLLLLAAPLVASAAEAQRQARSRGSSSSGSASRGASHGGSGSASHRPSGGHGGSSGGDHRSRTHRPTGVRHSGSGSHHHHGGGYYYRPGVSFYGFFGYPYPYYYPFGYRAGYPYYYGGYGGYGGYAYYGDRYDAGRRPAGAIDLNVKPKKAEVYVDGRYVGVVGGFDGFPRYLWLPAGDHQLTIYRQGFANLERRVEVFPGEVVKLFGELEPGEGNRPEQGYGDDYDYEDDYEPPPASSSAADAADGRPWRPAPEAYGASRGADLRGEPARLDLEVAPPDASVYLDGRFLGTAQELRKLRQELVIDPGEHELQVLHPDFASRRVQFEAVEGGRVDLTVDLRQRQGDDI